MTDSRDIAAQPDHLGWKPHFMRCRDGKGGWAMLPAELQFMHYMDGSYYYQSKFHWFCGYGVAQMDNGEVVFMGDLDHSKPNGERPAICFSSDRGQTWTPLKLIGRHLEGRPMALTYLGKGDLMFDAQYKGADTRFFSHDYGRTWPERAPVPVSSYGKSIFIEGNYMIDRDENGVATRIAGFGWMGPTDYHYPTDPAIGGIHCSYDGGRTWIDEHCPSEWLWKEEFQGNVYERGVSEGSLVRTANGWIVAALRIDMEARYFHFHNDNLEGIGVSVSKDEGKTWSPINVLYPSGRMHPHMLRMPDGALVMTYIMRQDVVGSSLASYLRGCGAVVSRDNGLTWDTDHDYLLDAFEFADGTPHALACGHIYSALLDDGSIITTYGHYPSKGACLVRWKPAAS